MGIFKNKKKLLSGYFNLNYELPLIKEYIDTNYDSPEISEQSENIPSVQFMKWQDLSYEDEKYDRTAINLLLEKYPQLSKLGYVEPIEKSTQQTFSEKMFAWIGIKGLTTVDVYNAAGIDRKLFSKISSITDYKPSKDTCISICIALKLTLDETSDMLKRAGYSLSHSIRRDVAIEYCIKNNIWPVANVDLVLYALALDTLSNVSF